MKSESSGLGWVNRMLGSTLVGRYQIISHLGGGGFGETFIASDTHLPGSPQCVVKKLKPQANDPVTLETARRLFDTEAQVLFRLGTHDRIPQLLAYFEEHEEFYLVQEFIEGSDLSLEIIPEKPVPQDQVIALLEEILTILEFVHQQKVIHRDVNPYNILRRRSDGKLILIDFGAVKQIVTQVVSPNNHTKFTVAIGTPGYIPSEQAQGNPKFSSDVYAVGILGIQALTGLSPEELEKDAETCEIIWRHRTSVSEDFAKVLDKMVCYDFRQRYSSASVALQALKELNKAQSQTIALSPPANNHKNTHTQIKSQRNSPKNIFLKVLAAITLIGTGTAGSIYVVNAINSTNAVELYQQANTLYDLQRYKDALLTYDRAIELRPDYAKAWNGQGKTLYELKKYREALTAYDKAIQIQPDYLEAWRGRGFTLSQLQRYQESVSSLDKALLLNKNQPDIWNEKGDILTKIKQYDQAIDSYNKAIELRQDYYEAWYNKALVFNNLRRYDEALVAYDKVTEIKPAYDRAWYSRGNVLVNLRRNQDAISSYEKAVQYKPNNYLAWLSRGNLLNSLQRYQEAVDSFEQVIKYNPTNYQAWYGRAWSFHQMQRYEEAVLSYDKAVQFKRGNYQAWYGRGNSLYNLKKYQEAIVSYNRAIGQEPNHYEPWYSKGNALLNLKLYQDAISAYNKALKLKPDYQPAIEARDRARQQLLLPIQNPVETPNSPPPQ
jgi:tetratricopeptide (TPR) repeat protein